MKTLLWRDVILVTFSAKDIRANREILTDMYSILRVYAPRYSQSLMFIQQVCEYGRGWAGDAGVKREKNIARARAGAISKHWRIKKKPRNILGAHSDEITRE